MLSVDVTSLDKSYSDLLNDLEHFNCKCIETRIFASCKMEEIEGFLNFFRGSRIGAIVLKLKWAKDVFESIGVLIKRHVKLAQVIFFEAPLALHAEHYGIHVKAVTGALDSMRCGQVCIENMQINIQHYAESTTFNTCLNRKISVDAKGDIKNCPTSEKIYGNIATTSIREVITNLEFQKYWRVKKDDIKVCQDCEYRYICMDCRILIEDKDDLYSKPAKCTYNPYTTTWT